MICDSVFQRISSVEHCWHESNTNSKNSGGILQEKAQTQMDFDNVGMPKRVKFTSRRSGYLSKWTLSCHLPKMYQIFLTLLKNLCILETKSYCFGLMSRTEEILLLPVLLTSYSLFSTLFLLYYPSFRHVIYNLK